MILPASEDQNEAGGRLRSSEGLKVPFTQGPFGSLVMVRPGLFWAQLPLPYQPGHVNTYLIDEGDGWCVVDTGLYNDETCAIWDQIIANLPHHRIIKHVLVTHWHSDHSGCAGWLCGRYNAPLLMSESEYFKCLLQEFFPRDASAKVVREHFLRHGLNAETTEEWVKEGHKYVHMMSPMPHSYKRLVSGDNLALGSKCYTVRTAAGHATEQVMLKDSEAEIFLCADQFGLKIAPNLAVQSFEPFGNPLQLYLRELDRIADDGLEHALLLPGHEPPFQGLAVRIRELKEYHDRRCKVVAAACSERPHTACELVSKLFRRPPGPVWIGFVISEALTYANFLVYERQLVQTERGGVFYFQSTADS